VPYDKTTDRITIPMVDFFDLLEKAAALGIRIGLAKTAGDHTSSGIAYTVFQEYMKDGGSWNSSTGPQPRTTAKPSP
jgi:hypothetical protein